MNASAYELLASIARYWFLALAALIAVRLILAVVREMRIEWRVQREISEAGTSINATLVLLSDEDRRMRRGKLYAVEGETTVGRSHNCDVRIGSPSLKGTHCILNMEADGMNVVPVAAPLMWWTARSWAGARSRRTAPQFKWAAGVPICVWRKEMAPLRN